LIRTILAVSLGLVACAPSPEVPAERISESENSLGRWEIDSPAGPFSFAPNLLAVGDHLILSWLEQSELPSGDPYHRLLVSRLIAGSWSAPAVVAEGADFFANWADIPAVAAAADGSLYAHWLAKTGTDTYAYSIFLARSVDEGASWTPMGPLNDDDTLTEHGFVSFVTQGEGVRAFWLDGRQMADGGPMNVRTAMVTQEVGLSEVLDDRVCECCATDAAITAQGPVVVSRDRSDEEIRDIVVVRQIGDSWTESERIAADEWRIEGCPVNGPAVAAAGDKVAAVWYTAGGSGPRVQLALSMDAGATFGSPQIVDGSRPLGRVDLVDDGSGGFLASWLEGADETAEIRLRRFDGTGSGSEPTMVARTSVSRASGFPRLARVGDQLFLAWVDIESEETSRVRVLEIPVSAIN